MNPRSAAAKVRAAVTQTTAARRERQRLERELADYNTPAQRLDLDAMISRYSPDETRHVRAILARQDLHASRRARVGQPR